MNKAALSVICIIYSFYRSFDPVIPKLININTALIYSESTLHNPHPRPRSTGEIINNAINDYHRLENGDRKGAIL